MYTTSTIEKMTEQTVQFLIQLDRKTYWNLYFLLKSQTHSQMSEGEKKRQKESEMVKIFLMTMLTKQSTQSDKSLKCGEAAFFISFFSFFFFFSSCSFLQ